MINKIVTSLKVSKKLKELGIIQESIFYWVRFPHFKTWSIGILDNGDLITFDGDSGLIVGGPEYYYDNIQEKISAWTVTELGMMLDLMTVDPDDDYVSHCWPDNQAQKGIFEMLDQYRLPSGKLEFDGMIDNLNNNLKEWKNKRQKDE